MLCSDFPRLFSQHRKQRGHSSSFETVNIEELKSGPSVNPSCCQRWLMSFSFNPSPFFCLVPSTGQARRLSRPCSVQGSSRGLPPYGWGWARPSWQHWVGAKEHDLEASRTPRMRGFYCTGASTRIRAGWKVTWNPGRNAGCPLWSYALLKHDSWEEAHPLWGKTQFHSNTQFSQALGSKMNIFTRLKLAVWKHQSCLHDSSAKHNLAHTNKINNWFLFDTMSVIIPSHSQLLSSNKPFPCTIKVMKRAGASGYRTWMEFGSANLSFYVSWGKNSGSAPFVQ